MRVKVTGLEKAIRMALDDVLERMDVVYQMAQRSLEQVSALVWMRCKDWLIPLSTYYEATRDGGFEGICKLVCILADAAFALAHMLPRITQARLSSRSCLDIAISPARIPIHSVVTTPSASPSLVGVQVRRDA